jgi:hypothetical protein
MSDPIDYAILLNLKAALQAMSVVRGYHYTLATLAIKLDPNHSIEELIPPDGPRPVVILEANPEKWVYFPANELRIVLPVTIHWIQESDPTSDESWLETYLCGCADVERAIAVDTTRGGRAVDTRITTRTLEKAIGGALVWAQIDVEIAFYRQYGQPDVA